MSVFMPEITIRKYLLQFIIDIKADVTKFNNLVFGTTLVPVGDFDIKAEMNEIFAVDIPFNIKFGINISTAELPAVHIYLPKEERFFQGIGASGEFTFDDTDEVVDEENEIYYNTDYSLMIVDANADKVLILYNTLKYMFYRYVHVLEMEGFLNLKISGNDLITEQNILPKTIFARNLNLNFQYEFSTQNVIKQLAGGDLVIDNNIDMHK